MSTAQVLATSDDQLVAQPSSLAGSGFSTLRNLEDAVDQAINSAKQQLGNRSPNFAIVFDGNGGTSQKLFGLIATKLGKETKVWAALSGSKISFNDQKLACAETGEDGAEQNQAISILLVASDEVKFGVATANSSDFSSTSAAAASAISTAIEDAGIPEGSKPTAVMLSSQFGRESEILTGIESVVGIDVPVLGGSSFGSFTASGNSQSYTGQGVSVAVFGTDLPLGWTFEAGFEIQDPVSAEITKLDGTRILELDGRPAFEVYDEWFGGRMRELCQAGDNAKIRELRNLNPICKRIETSDKQTYYNFTITYPRLDDLSVEVKIDVEVGDRLYLSEGNWESLMNRVCSAPKNAKSSVGIDAEMQILFGVGFYCGGVIDLIPKSELGKIPKLVRNANNRSPFVACVTAGEQGHFPGLGSKHGHLSTSFLLIGHPRSDRD